MAPANGQFTVELAMNRAFTSLSFNGQFRGTFADGQNHPGLGDAPPDSVPPCITEPNTPHGSLSRLILCRISQRVLQLDALVPVTGVTGNAAVAPGTPGVWCEDDPSKCLVGAKQMIYWNQAEGNNVEVSGLDLAGESRSPAYNTKMGFPNDIFQKAGSATQTSVSPGPTSTHKPSSSLRLVVDYGWLFVAVMPALAPFYH
ncbi:hypothetical protein DXG01_008024 [Tephrocybe rancida]|nr:hypothetical protein DXG01_008024 [Tephrocybe rancida]